MASLKIKKSSSSLGGKAAPKQRNLLSRFTSSKSTVSPLVALDSQKKSIGKKVGGTTNMNKDAADADAPHCYDDNVVLSCPYYRKHEVTPTPQPLKPKAFGKPKPDDPPGYVLKRSETLQREAVRKQLEQEKLALEQAKKEREYQIERMQNAIKLARTTSNQRQAVIRTNKSIPEEQKRRLIKQEKLRANQQVYSMVSEDTDDDLLDEFDLKVYDLDGLDDDDVDGSFASHYNSLYDHLTSTFSMDTNSMYSVGGASSTSTPIRKTTSRVNKSQ